MTITLQTPSPGSSSVPRAFVAALALLLAGSSLVACSVPRTKLPAERVVRADNERVLWTALRAAIFELDYAVGGGADSSGREIQTGWKLDMQPFRGAGRRTRVIAKYERVPGEPGDKYESFDVRIRVEKDKNMSLVRQLEPAYAKWEPDDDDEVAAKTIMQRLVGSLGTAELEFEREKRPYGLD